MGTADGSVAAESRQLLIDAQKPLEAQTDILELVLVAADDEPLQEAASVMHGIVERIGRIATEPFDKATKPRLTQPHPTRLHVSRNQALTLKIPSELTELAESVGSTPAVVLKAFIADLCQLPGSNGSDERKHAEAWFHRVLWSTLDFEEGDEESDDEEEEYDDDMGEYDAWRDDNA